MKERLSAPHLAPKWRLTPSCVSVIALSKGLGDNLSFHLEVKEMRLLVVVAPAPVPSLVFFALLP